MSIKDFPHVTVEQVLTLRKAAIEIEERLKIALEENDKYKYHLLDLEEEIEKTSFIELENVHLKQQLAELKASLPKVRADAFEAGVEWCEAGISSYRISQAADIYAAKMEAGNE